MKRMLAIALGMLLIGSAAVAAEFVTSGNSNEVVHDAPDSRDCDWISQNFDPWSVDNSQVACANQGAGYTTENWWARQYFLLEDHWLSGEVGVSQVAFAVEMCSAAFTTDIVLYTIGNTVGVAFGWQHVTEYARVPVAIGPANDMSILYVDFDPVCVDADVQNIVVAIDAPHGEGGGPGGSNVMFWSGANAFGALMDSYLASASCGLPDPTPIGAIGFPDAQTVLNLCITEDCGEPTPVSESSWGAVKSLYR